MARKRQFTCVNPNTPTGVRNRFPQSTYPNPPDIYTSSDIPTPAVRPLNVFAFDPSAGKLVGNHMTAAVRYEENLKPGPVSDRFAVIDYDGGTGHFYKPIDLNDHKLMVGGGLAPSETDPRFHQQMVYAVASETLQRFEYALGRKIHWRWFKREGENESMADKAMNRLNKHRLNLYPHAMCQANAFYSPEAHGILFGYFRSRGDDPQSLPGQTVFTCLSHDIIAHEVTHAIVDGVRSYFTEPTNFDVAAFHEAFADIAALFAHFSHETALLDTLQKTGGRLFDFKLKAEAPDGEPRSEPMIQAEVRKANPLIELAMEFGQSVGHRSGLRSALGMPPSPQALATITEPHERGAILVAAVFDAYFTIYTRRSASLFRIFRAGGGSVSQDLPESLAKLLATEASRTAEQFFTICARALDYCPPIDITFGDFLRAILTADRDLRREDPDGVRDALIEAFRMRGIVAEDAVSYSEDAIFWPEVRKDALPCVKGLRFGDPNGLTKAEKDHNGEILREYAKNNAVQLGFDPDRAPIAAPSFHPTFHTQKDGSLFVNMVVELVQTVNAPCDPNSDDSFEMRNGVTLIIAQDPVMDEERPDPRVLFVIPKLHSAAREERIRAYYHATGRMFSIKRGPDTSADRKRFMLDFAMLHSGI